MKNDSFLKKCPRCKSKCYKHEKKCSDCGLIFERLNYTSNKCAKKLLLKGKYKDTIKTYDWPVDVKKSTALFLCIFLGYTGAHNFYVGRFLKALISLTGFILSIIMVILTDYIYGSTLWNILWLFALIPGTCVLWFWFSDLIFILFEKYKIPVAIDDRLYNLKNTIIEDHNKENNNLKEKNKNNGKKEK